MQVNAINSVKLNNTNFEGRRNYQNNINEDNDRQTYDEYQKSQGRQSRMANAAKSYALAALLMSPVAGGVLSSCGDEINIAHVHNINIKCPVPVDTVHDTVYFKEVLPPDTIYKIDTVYKNHIDTIIQPGKPDTIYVPHTDTIYVTVPVPDPTPSDPIYVQPDFKSPVADSIKTDLGIFNINGNSGSIPIAISFYDEYETTTNSLKFNGLQSSQDRLVYDDKMTGWYGDVNYSRYEFSIGNGGLVMEIKKPKTSGKPSSNAEWETAKTYVFKRSGKEIAKYENNGGSLKRVGTIRKGDIANSIFDDVVLPNGETETWRYSNIKITNHNMTMDQLYNDYKNSLDD